MGPQIHPVKASPTAKRKDTYKRSTSTGSESSLPELDDQRGRVQERDRSPTTKGEYDSGAEKQTAEGQTADKPRKRKRSRKGLEKNFACPHPECGKSYSRAEHLYRHQLNHQPKRIYACDHPGCERTFVRQDLCTRHKERHTARGSHLQRKDSALRGSENGAGASKVGPQGHLANDVTLNAVNPNLANPMISPYPLHPHIYGHSTGQHPEAMRALKVVDGSDNDARSTPLDRSHSEENYYATVPGGFEPNSLVRRTSNPFGESSGKQTRTQGNARPHNGSHADPYRTQSRLDVNTGLATYRPSSASSFDSPSVSRQSHNVLGEDAVASPQGFNALAPLAPPHLNNTQSSFAIAQGAVPTVPYVGANIENAAAFDSYTGPHLPGTDPGFIENVPSAYQTPFWNHDIYGHSPRNTADELVNLLFNDSAYAHGASSPGGPRQGSMPFSGNAFIEDDRHFALSYDVVNGQHGQNIPQQHPMALNHILDPASLHAILSDEKRQEVLRIIGANFNGHSPVSKQKNEIFAGDHDAEHHVLSLRQMQLYVRSYWYHFHPQMPILHKPTFSADDAPNLLLIAVIAIGASCLDKMHGADVTDAGADLANFLAWHLRGEVFKHEGFSPPAQLWIFQTLLLLELYEKMYSTRVLHERAHIHHGTTLTLLRRGSSLIGRSPLDSPPTEKNGGEVNGEHHPTMLKTPEQWWQHWITNEATRRVVFAAFIIDTIHATMFGHQAIMVAHEMKLALPCDENLWSATTSGEVAKKEADMRANGNKSMTFFDGLKSTLKGKPVQTNPFGRMAIMAGLLSVTWHMNQRDVQIHHLGALKALGGKDVWRGPLTKAFDSWVQDFDASMSKDNLPVTYPGAKIDEQNIFESRVVLHHLAHMAMHVDIVSCQIFAGASRLLGRDTLKADYDIAQKRIRFNWAPRPSARHATFYALRFLAQVLMPDLTLSFNNSPGSAPYSARDDFLLNRPWVLYYAALVVWSYGYALDGPLKEAPNLSTQEEKAYDTRQYLNRFGCIPAPQDLGNMTGRNACLGLLYILREKFEKCRWQLLHEAARLLGNCIAKLLDGGENGQGTGRA